MLQLFQDGLNKETRLIQFIYFWTHLLRKKGSRCLLGCTTIASVFLSLIGENDLLQSNDKTEWNQMSLWSVILQ